MTIPQVLHRVYRGEDRPPSYTFTFPNGRGTITGIDQLTQTTLMHLLTTPGSDRYLSEEGGGLQGAFQRMLQGGNFARAAADISEAVARTKSQIFTSQIEEDGLSARERLADLRIDRIEQIGTRIALRISIVSEADEVSTIAI